MGMSQGVLVGAVRLEGCVGSRIAGRGRALRAEAQRTGQRRGGTAQGRGQRRGAGQRRGL